jgi:hypothetical protein
MGDEMKQFWKEKWKTLVSGVVLIVLSMVAVYFGAKWWLHYANTEAFKGEVNAAIITGIIGVLTLIGTVFMQAYSTRKMQRLTVRDVIFQQRVVVYQKIFNDMAYVSHRLYDFLNHPTEEAYQKIKEGYQQLNATYWDNYFIMSNEVRKLFARYKFIFEMLTAIDIRLPIYWNGLLAEAEVKNRDKPIIRPLDIYDGFLKPYGPLLFQMKKELHLKIIDDEIEKLLK